MKIFRLNSKNFPFIFQPSIPSGWENFEAQIAEIDGRKVTEIETTSIVTIVTEISKAAPKEESPKVTQLNENIMDMVYFVDEMEVTMSDLHQLDLQNQLTMLEKLQEKLKSQVEDYEKSKLLLDECKKESSNSGRLQVEDQHIQELGSKYDLIGFKIEDMIESAKLDYKKEKFYKIKLTLADARDWFKQHANESSKEDLEQRLVEMKELNEDIKDVREVCEENNEWKRDFQQFDESWR